MQRGSVLDDRYRIDAILGQGGMGVVYKAHDLLLNKTVALKGLPADLASDARAIALLKKEVKNAQELRHQNICATFDFRQADEMPYIVMEFVEGETLKNFIFRQEGHRCDEQTFRKLAKQILAAVAHAHEAGVIHRDLKPLNVMLTASGAVRVMDFGIAANIKETLSRTSARFIAFSAPYASPEQIQGSAPHISMDIYSLGCLFYEMLTGAPPFSRGNIEYQQLNIEPKPMSGVPANLNDAILACLVKDPLKRCSDVTALEEMLLRKPEVISKQEVISPPRRAPVAVLAAVAVAAVAAGGYGLRELTRSDPPSQEKATGVETGKGDSTPSSTPVPQSPIERGKPESRNGIASAAKVRDNENQLMIRKAQQQYDNGYYDEAIRILNGMAVANEEARALMAKVQKAKQAELRLKK